MEFIQSSGFRYIYDFRGIFSSIGLFSGLIKLIVLIQKSTMNGFETGFSIPNIFLFLLVRGSMGKA